MLPTGALSDDAFRVTSKNNFSTDAPDIRNLGSNMAVGLTVG
jgi:hypothetical protein